MNHSEECESTVKARIAQLEPALESMLEKYRDIQERYQAGEDRLVLKLFEAANGVMAVDMQIHKYELHLAEHRLDYLELRVLELELNTDARVDRAVRDYFSATLDTEES